MRTEGQHLLGRVAHRYTQEAIAEKLGVSQTIISQWISGRCKPVYENRRALFENYGIDMDAWERPWKPHQPQHAGGAA
jgi:transcriptional regulator with XRE-family HTH domain